MLVVYVVCRLPCECVYQYACIFACACVWSVVWCVYACLCVTYNTVHFHQQRIRFEGVCPALQIHHKSTPLQVLHRMTGIIWKNDTGQAKKDKDTSDKERQGQIRQRKTRTHQTNKDKDTSDKERQGHIRHRKTRTHQTKKDKDTSDKERQGHIKQRKTRTHQTKKD